MQLARATATRVDELFSFDYLQHVGRHRPSTTGQKCASSQSRWRACPNLPKRRASSVVGETELSTGITRNPSQRQSSSMLGYDSPLTVPRPRVKQWLRPSESGREVRLPLHVRVLTRPNYGECWSLNLSSGGMALGVAQPSGDPPAEGSPIEMEFLLPGNDARFSIRGRVKWFGHHIAPLSSPYRFAFGVSFTEVRPNDRAILARYVVDYRPQVVVAYPSSAESALCRELLEPDAEVHDASSEQALQRLLSRGDVYVVVVFVDDESQALKAVQQATSGQSPGNRPDQFAFLGFAPRVVFCAEATPQR